MGIDLTSILVTNLIGLMLLLLTVAGSRWRLQEHTRQAACLRCIAALILVSCLVDPLVFWADGTEGILNYTIVFAGNTWLYLANLILGPCWIVFVSHYLGQHIHKALIIVLGVFSFVSFMLIACNAFAPVLFSVDSLSVYHRGPAYWVAAATVAVCLLCTLIPYYKARKASASRHVFPMWALFAPVIIGTVVQSVSYGVSLVWPSISVSFAGVMLCLQDDLLNRDNLTSLYNRSTFWASARKMIDSQPQASYTLLISDIQNFKGINERYGVAAGDKLLRYVGEHLQAMNSKESLFARYSGDQFVGIIRMPGGADQTQEYIEQSEQAMLAAMDELYKNAPVPEFHADFGMYVDVDKSLPVATMCDYALMAVRDVKLRYDRSIGYYDDSMGEQLRRAEIIIDQKESALEQGQFEVYYQPKHSAQTGQVVGAEALVRWNHPEYGLMSPGEFLPLFEANGFITHVDYYVWETVCRDIATWIDGGHKAIPASVNTSRRDYFYDNSAAYVRRAVENCGVDLSLLHVEVTESAYVDCADELAERVREIQKLGIKIELDDFGSGYSSLGNLARMPLDIIKLDMAFMREFDAQRDVVQAAINLGHDLGLQVVAEGVETAEQLEALRTMGCDIIQGYYYSPPLCRDDFEAYLIAQGL